MENLIFVKLGGGLITDKNRPHAPKLEVIDRLAEEITEARKEKKFNLIIGNGVGSYGHIPAKKYNLAKGFIDQESKYGLCKTHNEVVEINRIVVDALLKTGEKAFSMSPSSFFLADNDKLNDSFLKIIKRLVECDIVTVLHGDTIIDLKKGCCIFSTEDSLVYLAEGLKPRRVIFASKVDGVFTDDPIKNEEAEFIPEINKENWEKIKKCLKGSDGIDVTGGMAQKVEKSIELAKTGCQVSIINGNKAGYLKRALLGENLGTLIKWRA